MNPCPRGNAGEPARVCICAAREINRYQSRLSGPLADRIDMHVTLSAVPARVLQADSAEETSADVRQRVERCRATQRERYKRVPGVSCNAHASGRWLLANGCVDTAARRMLGDAMDALHLSARGYHRVLRVARTIADLDDSNTITTGHVAEALRFRPRGAVSERETALAGAVEE